MAAQGPAVNILTSTWGPTVAIGESGCSWLTAFTHNSCDFLPLVAPQFSSPGGGCEL